MGGNSGPVIIRQSMQTALTDPVVSGQLPAHHKVALDPFITADVGTWSHDQQKIAFKAFEWAEKNCK